MPRRHNESVALIQFQLVPPVIVPKTPISLRAGRI